MVPVLISCEQHINVPTPQSGQLREQKLPMPSSSIGASATTRFKFIDPEIAGTSAKVASDTLRKRLIMFILSSCIFKLYSRHTITSGGLNFGCGIFGPSGYPIAEVLTATEELRSIHHSIAF